MEVHPQWRVFPRFALSPDLVGSLSKKARDVDVIHNHSTWSMVNVAAGLVVPGRGAKLVTSPRGTLADWAMKHSRTKKKMLWPLQKRLFEQSDLIHVTSAEEYEDVRRLGFVAPVAIVPNGIDVPDVTPRLRTEDGCQLLYLGRIHPTKGIERLLQAWADCEPLFPRWHLSLVGPGERAYVQGLRKLSERLALRRVKWMGPAFGDEKTECYSRADLFVLPTHSENFGVVVAEALSHGCPALVTKGAPWAGLETEGSGWWVDNHLDGIRAGLFEALSKTPEELSDMGENGREWMIRDFAWSNIARKMDAAYRWLIDGGLPPKFVQDVC